MLHNFQTSSYNDLFTNFLKTSNTFTYSFLLPYSYHLFYTAIISDWWGLAHEIAHKQQLASASSLWRVSLHARHNFSNSHSLYSPFGNLTYTLLRSALVNQPSRVECVRLPNGEYSECYLKKLCRACKETGHKEDTAAYSKCYLMCYSPCYIVYTVRT